MERGKQIVQRRLEVVVFLHHASYAPSDDLAQHTSGDFHYDEDDDHLPVDAPLRVEIGKADCRHAYGRNDGRHVADGSHDQIEDEGNRYDLVEQNRLFEPFEAFHGSIDDAGAFCQLHHDAEGGNRHLQRQTLKQVEDQHAQRPCPRQGGYGIERRVAAPDPTEEVHGYTLQNHQQRERQEGDQAYTLLPVVAAAIKE